MAVNFHIGVEGTGARFTTQTSVQATDRVCDNKIVHDARASHRVDDAAQILVLDGREQLAGKIIFHGHQVHFLGCTHAISLLREGKVNKRARLGGPERGHLNGKCGSDITMAGQDLMTSRIISMVVNKLARIKKRPQRILHRSLPIATCFIKKLQHQRPFLVIRIAR